MADRRVSYWVWWLLLLGFLLTGAGLLTSRDPTRQIAGTVLLFVPLAVFSLVALAYYLKQQAIARRQP